MKTRRSLVTILIFNGFIVVTYFHANRIDVHGKDITANQKLVVRGMKTSNAPFERCSTETPTAVEAKKLVISRDVASPYPYEANNTRFLCVLIRIGTSACWCKLSPLNSLVVQM